MEERKKRALICIAVLFVLFSLIVALLLPFVPGYLPFVGKAEDRLYMDLMYHRKNSLRARPIASELGKTEYGVKLAVTDANVFGGRTRGWSS